MRSPGCYRSRCSSSCSADTSGRVAGSTVTSAEAIVSWGGWLVVTGLVLHLHERHRASPTTASRWHPPSPLVGMGSTWAWRTPAGLGRPNRDGSHARAGRLVVGAAVEPQPLRHPVGAMVGRIPDRRRGGGGIDRQTLVGEPGVAVGTLGAAAGTVAFAIATAMTPHHGAIPNAVSSVHRTPQRAADGAETGGGRSPSAAGTATRPPTTISPPCWPQPTLRGRPRRTDRSLPPCSRSRRALR